MRLFQATQRPTQRDGGWIATQWGRCRVVGRLGQRHADLLEAILYTAERDRETDDGGIELLVDPAAVRRCLSDGRSSLTRIREWLKELRAATVEIETQKLAEVGERILGGLIDHVEPSPMTRRDPLKGSERHLWRVRLGRPLVLLLAHDLHLRYDPAPIARLEHGVSQGVARHILTHQAAPPGGWKLDGLIDAVAGPLTNQARRDARRRLRADAPRLAALGIAVESDRVRRVR